MADKELKKLKRIELLELLVDSYSRIEELEAKLAEAEEKLADRELKMNEAGNIAEASLKLNDIFESAQNAADQYLESVQKGSGAVVIRDTKVEEEAEKRAKKILLETREKCLQLVKKSKQEADDYWDETYSRIQRIIEKNEFLKQQQIKMKKGENND